MRISDWSSDVCSSDLSRPATPAPTGRRPRSPGASEEERSARTARQRTLLAPVPPGILPAQLLSGERLELSLRQRCRSALDVEPQPLQRFRWPHAEVVGEPVGEPLVHRDRLALALID